MMFGQYQGDIAAGDENARANPYNPNPDATFTQGTGKGIAQGFERGAAKAELAEGDLLPHALLRGAMKALTPSLGMTDADYDDALNDWRKNNVDRVASLDPDPHTVGWLGRTAGGLAEVLPEAAAGSMAGPLGSTGMVAGIQGYADFRTGERQGLDPVTAAKTAAVTGTSQAAGILMPAGFGGSLFTRLATGATGNVTMGIGQRYATSTILDNAGYKDMAAQYKPLDKASIASDAVMGAAFGALSRLGAKEQSKDQPKPSDVDAALMSKNIQNLEVDSAPGVPTNPETRDAHVATMKAVQEQMIKGEPVDTSGTITHDLQFLKRESLEAFNPEYQEQRSNFLYALENLNSYAEKNANIIGQGTDFNHSSDVALEKSAEELPYRIADINERLKDQSLPPDWRSVMENYRKDLLKVNSQFSDFQEARANNDLLWQWAHPEMIGTENPPKPETLGKSQEPIDLSPDREKDILARKPDLQIVHEDTGEAVPATQALQEADNGVKEAQSSRDLFNAAVNCFLKWG